MVSHILGGGVLLTQGQDEVEEGQYDTGDSVAGMGEATVEMGGAGTLDVASSSLERGGGGGWGRGGGHWRGGGNGEWRERDGR